MSQHEEKARQESSLIGRILSMEALLFLMGLVSLGYGIYNGVMINIFWGVVIIPGVFLLHKVRKKDWAKHWAEMEAEQKARQAYIERKKQQEQEARQEHK